MLQCGGFFVSGKMQYSKPPLNFSEQTQLLLSRGLIADPNELEDFLSKVNYYRFSGYLYPFRSGINEQFIKGTTFHHIRNIYDFDSELRHFTLSAIEIIEIAITRTQMVEKFTLAYGPFCYTDFGHFYPKLNIDKYQRMMDRINENSNNSKEEFVEAYRLKYSDEINLPFWMIAEIISFGLLSEIFSYLPYSVLVPISKKYNLHSAVLCSWIHTLSNIRNICAHHARLWNRKLPIRPLMPNKKYHPEFYPPNSIKTDRYVIVLTILNYLLRRINPKTSLIMDFCNLKSKFPEVPYKQMGFNENWEDLEIFDKNHQ